MDIRENLIHFQNKAEQDFLAAKTVKNLLKYILALIVFFSSTLFAVFTLPFRLLLKALLKNKKTGEIQTVDKQNIDKILTRKGLVLLDFWAEWCGPCVLMNPMLEKFASTSSGICVAKVNADANKALLDRFKIKGLPQFVLIKNGKEVKRHAGPMTLKELNMFCLVAEGQTKKPVLQA